MKVTNQQVYGLEESMIASGYPMSTKIPKGNDYEADKFEISYHNNIPERAIKLGNAKAGSGHDCYLKGITVQADLTCSQAMHMQFLRYHFVDIVSSQSKMHRLTKMDITSNCNKYVEDRVIETVENYAKLYNNAIKEKLPDKTIKDRYLRVIYNCPMGLELTFRFTTNYLQLKTIYNQRKNHRLPEWRVFTNWVLGLPHFKELVGIGKSEERR